MKKLVLAVLVLCSVGAVSVSAIADDSGNFGACHSTICS